MSSQMGNDGSYTLTVTFDIGTDVNTALVMVQNRVALAMPQLPTAGPEPGDHDPQEDARHLDDRQLLLAGRPLRRHLPEQLRHDLRQGRAAARVRSFGHQLHGPARLQHPRLARPAEAGVAEHDRHGCGERDPHPEPRCARRADRPVARPVGQPFQLPVDTVGRLTDPEQFESIVVKAGTEHRAGAGDRHRPPARRGPRRDGRAELQPVVHVRRPPVRGPLHLPAPRHQRTRRRRPGASQDGGAQDALSGRCRLRHRLRHDAVHPRVGQRGLQDLARRGASWSASWCWSSCRTGGP